MKLEYVTKFYYIYLWQFDHNHFSPLHPFTILKNSSTLYQLILNGVIVQHQIVKQHKHGAVRIKSYISDSQKVPKPGQCINTRSLTKLVDLFTNKH